jgi:hypothetical protein
MAIDVTRLLETLRAVSAGGGNVAALDLHLEALIAARNGDLAAASQAFTSAQQWEAAHGHADAALHTAHQMALTTNFDGDLAKLDHYYRETTRTLTKMRNRKGVALCMRSVGEIAIVKGDGGELMKAWELSERLFRMLRLPESSQLAAWRACVGEVLA